MAGRVFAVCRPRVCALRPGVLHTAAGYLRPHYCSGAAKESSLGGVNVPFVGVKIDVKRQSVIKYEVIAFFLLGQDKSLEEPR